MILQIFILPFIFVVIYIFFVYGQESIDKERELKRKGGN